MPTVQVIRKISHGRWGERHEEAEFMVDGEVVAHGAYGGEPEDNSRFRDYAWVEKAIRAIAEKLGCRFVVTEQVENQK